MDEKLLNNIKALTDKRDINSIIRESIDEIKLSKKSLWQYVIACLTGLLLAYVVGFSKETVSTMAEISEVLFEAAIGVIGIVLGAYAIFQALMQKELILILIKSDNNLLRESNKTFLNIIILYVIDALVSLSIKVTLSATDEEFCIFDSMQLNNIIAMILIFFYLAFNLLLLLELIIFSVNLYRMFCVHNTVSAIDALGDEEKA